VDDGRSQAAISLSVGLGDVEQAQHFLAFEPGKLKRTFDKVPVDILP
jgi:hypothetical protein